MHAAVVYESSWGNTRAVAEAIAAGLCEHVGTDVVEVQNAPPLADLQADLLVVGGPTHAFGLSREGTRQDAHRRGGTLVATGVREWIEAADSAELPVATFDTHVRHPNLPGSAGRSAARKLRRLGCTLVAGPVSFYVEDYEGPLLPGELDRARDWGTGLAAHLGARGHGT
jgi:hypothetical protein